jgi:hypothetical protein
MTSFRLSRGWDHLIVVPACLVPMLLVMLAMHSQFGSWQRPAPIFLFIAPLLLLYSAVCIAEIIWPPFLNIGQKGISVDWLIGSWSVAWPDIETIGIYMAPRGSRFIGIKVVAGSAAASSWKRSTYGYDRLIPNIWGKTHDDVIAAIDTYLPGSPSPARDPSTNSPSGGGFGHRTRSLG